MKAKDYLKDLPAAVNNIVELELPPKERALYEQRKDSLLQFAEGDIVANNAAVLSNNYCSYRQARCTTKTTVCSTFIV